MVILICILVFVAIQICVAMIKHFATDKQVRQRNKLASQLKYLHEQMRFREYEEATQKVNELNKEIYGTDYLLEKEDTEYKKTIENMIEAAAKAEEESRYANAEYIMREVWKTQGYRLGFEHPDIAKTLNHIGRMLDKQGKNEEAELLYKRARDIMQKQSHE